jgi:hypothetical protein
MELNKITALSEPLIGWLFLKIPSVSFVGFGRILQAGLLDEWVLTL